MEKAYLSTNLFVCLLVLFCLFVCLFGLMYTYMILYMIIYIYAVYITCYTYTRSEFSKKGVLYVSHDVVDDVHNVLHACFPHNLQVSKFSIYTIYSSFAICGWIDTLNDMVTVEE